MNTLVIDITNKCNLACPYCFGPKNENHFLSLDEILEIVKKSNDSYVVITGGEPLLHKDLGEILKQVHSLGKKIILHSNGILITEEFLKSNKQYIYRLNLPLDSINPEINAKLRGKIHLDKVLNSINLSLKNNYRLSITSVFTSINKDYFEELAEFLSKLKIDLWRVFEFKNIYNNSEISYLNPNQDKIKNFKNLVKKYNFQRFEFIDKDNEFYNLDK